MSEEEVKVPEELREELKKEFISEEVSEKKKNKKKLSMKEIEILRKTLNNYRKILRVLAEDKGDYVTIRYLSARTRISRTILPKYLMLLYLLNIIEIKGGPSIKLIELKERNIEEALKKITSALIGDLFKGKKFLHFF